MPTAGYNFLTLSNGIQGGAVRHLGKLIAVLALIVMIAGVAAGCGDDPEEAAVKQVLEDQIEFLRSEDLEGAMSTMHPESPIYSETRTVLEQVFDLYELEYELEEVEIVEMGDSQAKIRAVQVTRRVNGPELEDARVTAIHTIRMTDDGWKLYDSVAESSEPLSSGG
jgi:hypothetical protein